MVEISKKTANKILYCGVVAVFLAFFGEHLFNHALWLVGGSGLDFILKDRWDIVLINVLFFVSFLVFIPFRKKVRWKERGIFSAFIIALFAEMYGFPLTAYFLSSFYGQIPVAYAPTWALKFNMFGVDFGLTLWNAFGGIITVIGLALIVEGWREVYKAKGLVTGGLYRLVRHPQYLGIFMVVFGWFLSWPILINVVLLPLLFVIYYKLARSEEMVVEKEFGARYAKYKNSVPMFLPDIIR